MTKTLNAATPKPRRPFSPLDAVVVFLVCALALVLILTTLVPALLGLTPYAVASNSMSPTLHRGDLVCVRPTPLAELSVGDVVTIRTTQGAVFTHRVYELDLEAGLLRTKADTSPLLDSGPFPASQLVGRVVYRIPLLGYLSLWQSNREEANP